MYCVAARQQDVSRMVTYLHIRARHDCATSGRLHLGQMVLPCVIGRSGRRHLKREGDGATPIGTWDLEQGWFRPDRMGTPAGALRLKPMKPGDGWCDAPSSGSYNRPVRLPFAASHERMWRKDGLYDVVFATSHNARPRLRFGGSAIFLHLVEPHTRVTEGCVALRLQDMRKLLALCGRKVRLVVWPCQGGPPRLGKSGRF